MGNGKSIHIWKDKWIPRPVTYSIQSPITILDENANVDNLLLPGSTEWNMDLLQTLFSADDVVLISTIYVRVLLLVMIGWYRDVLRMVGSL